MLSIFGATPVTPLSTITDATSTLLPQLLAVGGAGIAVGAGILVLRRGWGFFKGVAK
jgi:hypothetical protein